MSSDKERNLVNRQRDLNQELSIKHPLFLQNFYLINDIIDFLQTIPQGSKVVDIGCGTKPYARFLDKSCSYIGVDIDAENDNVDIVSSVYDIDLADSVADYIVSFQVMEHLEEPANMLKEAYRILKKDGMIFLTFPMSEELHEEPYDFFRYTEHGITYLLKKAGFTKIEVIRQGTSAANLGRRIAVKLHARWWLRNIVPVVNYAFFKLESRKGSDVMNYAIKAKKL